MGNIRANRTFYYMVFLVIGSSLTLSLLGQILIEGILNPILPTGPGAFLGYIFLFWLLCVVFIVFAKKTTEQAGRIVGVKVSATRSDHPALPFLIMGYSPLRGVNIDDLTKEIDKLGVENVAAVGGVFLDACQRNDHEAVVCNLWQQNLRSAWHHKDALRAIYVLDPSEDQFDRFGKYMSHAFKSVQKDISIVRIATKGRPDEPFQTFDGSGTGIPRSYENYEYVYEGLRRGVEMIGERDDLAAFVGKRTSGMAYNDTLDRNICIDATPGQKPFSVAAAVLTLNRPLKFSYVTTGPTGGEVCFYDTNVRLAGGS